MDANSFETQGTNGRGKKPRRLGVGKSFNLAGGTRGGLAGDHYDGGNVLGRGQKRAVWDLRFGPGGTGLLPRCWKGWRRTKVGERLEKVSRASFTGQFGDFPFTPQLKATNHLLTKMATHGGIRPPSYESKTSTGAGDSGANPEPTWLKPGCGFVSLAPGPVKNRPGFTANVGRTPIIGAGGLGTWGIFRYEGNNGGISARGLNRQFAREFSIC